MNLKKVIKRKFKHWKSTILPISTKQTTPSHLRPLNTWKTMTYDNGNPGPDLEPAQNVSGLILLTGSKPSPLGMLQVIIYLLVFCETLTVKKCLNFVLVCYFN
jgi:hypothetical protein